MLPDVIDLVSGVPQLQPSGLRSCWIGSFQPVRELSPQELLSYTGVSRFPSGLGPRFGEYLVNLTKEASKQAVGKAGAADSRARPKLTTQNGGFEERKVWTYLIYRKWQGLLLLASSVQASPFKLLRHI